MRSALFIELLPATVYEQNLMSNAIYTNLLPVYRSKIS